MIEIDALHSMDRAALVAAWSQTLGSPAPRGISRNLLCRFIAFEIQARRSGGLRKSVILRLQRSPPERRQAKTTEKALKPGGRLIREWNGTTHVVEVTDAGLMWNGATWRSLSAIAREITGAHWSGPRFFGLNRKARS